MTAEENDDFRASGEGEDTSEDSSTENNDEGQSGAETGDEGQGADDNKDDEFKDVPFHMHPRWKEREEQWNQRFEKQQTDFEEKMEKFSQDHSKPQADVEAEKIAKGPIPKWFGGGKDTPEVRAMWREYVEQQTVQLSQIEKRAEDRAFERITQGQSTQEKAVQEANQHFETSITHLEATFGKRVNRDELLKFTLDNKFIDPESRRWDYQRAYRFMMAEKGTPLPRQGGNQQREQRKQMARASMHDTGRGQERSGKTVTTSDDFKDSSRRPW